MRSLLVAVFALFATSAFAAESESQIVVPVFCEEAKSFSEFLHRGNFSILYMDGEEAVQGVSNVIFGNESGEMLVTRLSGNLACILTSFSDKTYSLPTYNLGALKRKPQEQEE
jgi:hypothetical protein